VENGKTTTYGTNRRYIESFGYNCTTSTDSEVIAYMIDLMVRRHGLDIDLAVRALAPPYWEEIDRMPEAEQKLNRALRFAYGSAAMNGPFTVVAANPDMMVGFTDRGKLRPMVVGECADRLYIASEESAIRAMEPRVESITRPAAGEPVIGRVAP
jgi:glutamate synthase domain-containing protein 1